MDKLSNYFTPQKKIVVDDSHKGTAKFFLILGLVGIVAILFGGLLLILGIVFKIGIVLALGIGIMIAAFLGMITCFILSMCFWDSTKEQNVYLSGSSYDALVKNKISSLGSNPREYVGLDSSEVEEIAPIVVEGYKFNGASKIRKDNKDALWRSDLYERAIIFFTLNEVHIYKAILNTLTEKITETTDVLFYEDIVSVSTKNEVFRTNNGNTIEYITFNLVSKGGNSMNIAIDNNKNVHNSINAMRAMIKEKKTQK